MQYPLPQPIPANYSYEALRIENIQYDTARQCYVADVFGVSGGQTLPFIFRTPAGLQRVSQCVITDAEIDAVQAARPEITSRLDAGLVRAMERLYALANG